jgi:glycosyltransferase involved in cell wall biosynthesis
MKTVVVEGWRFLPHSYAVVNQYQCLEILRRPEITLYHRDVPFFQSKWKATSGTMKPEHEEALRAIPVPPPGVHADAHFRIGFPHFFHNEPNAKRTFTWVTSEFKRIQIEAMGSGKKPWEELSKAQSTVIACSRWAGQGFLNSGLPKSRLAIVPCGADTSVFHPVSTEERAAIRKKLGWENRFVVINISAATWNKGLDLVMHAVARVSDAHPEILLCLKGSDSLYQSDAYAAGSLRLIPTEAAEKVRSKISYRGDVMSATDIAEWYQAADLYLSPYRAEGFNLPVLEAGACGLPVICTRGGSTDDFVDDSWTLRMSAKEAPEPNKLGWIIEPNFEEFVAHLKRAIDDAAWRRAASEAGAAWVRDRFTWCHSVDKLLKVILPA